MSRVKTIVQHGAIYTGATLLITVLGIIASVTNGAVSVEAASSHNYDSCVNGLTYKGATVDGSSILSIRNACNACTDGGFARGVLWFNDSMTSPDGNIVRIDSWVEETKSVSLWGAVYSCGQASGADNWGSYVWIGLPDQMKGNGTTISQMEGAADFFDLSQSYYGDSVYQAVCRGVVSSSKYSWSDIDTKCGAPPSATPNAYSLPNSAVFYPKKFREAAMNAGGCEDIVEGGVAKLKCSMKVSVNRCFDSAWGKYKNSTNTRTGKCYGDPSELVLIAPPYNDGGFSSKSKVSADSGTNESQNWDQDADTLEVEADSSGSATVKFSHKLQYVAESPSGNYNNASTNWTIKTDEVATNSTGTYATPGGATAESSWLPETGEISVAVSLGTEDEKTVCSTIEYVPKTVQWDNNDPRNMMSNTNPNNRGSTKACAKIVRSQTEEVGQIEFWSQSKVSTVVENDIPSLFAETLQKTSGDKVTLRLSTDYPSARANFEQKIEHEITLNNGITIGTNDTVDYTNMCTTWKIESDTSSNGKTDKYCASTYYTGSSTVNTTNNHSVSLNGPGTENGAEEKISYEKKVVPIFRQEVKKADGSSYDPKRWKYFSNANTGSGSGNSAARIEFVRPTEPDGEGPSSVASSDTGPMYAGEARDMVWNAHAKAINERRLIGYNSVAFLVPVSKSLSSANTKGDLDQNLRYPNRSSSNPCLFWTSRFSPLRSGCAQVNPGSSDFNPDYTPNGFVGDKTVNKSANMAVPDWVGDKYCNGFGFRWQYWHGVKHTIGNNTDWVYTADNQTYWTHYNAACRTIAKKPFVALWNGGLFVGNGSVSTSVASRYENTAVGTITANGGTLKRFGSWSEYLANVNGSIGDILPGVIPGSAMSGKGFASGAAYAWTGSNSGLLTDNSPLTIQNASTPLGYSQVSASSAILDRLQTYFKNHASLTALPSGDITVNDTQIYYFSGNLNITNNIILQSTGYNSVYQLPQIVIYVDGDINIGEDVTQIDAWLIARGSDGSGGKIDTCAGSFTAGATQASVNDSNPDSRPTKCTKKLVINGPVFAKTVTTNRSFGSDRISNNDADPENAADRRAVPAEVFNLSMENYLWAYAQAGRYGSSYTEAYSQELPPRY